MRFFKKTVLAVAILSMTAMLALAGGWGYEGDVGPDFWGGLSTDFVSCASGQSQSPINIIDSVAVPTNLDDIAFHYEDTELLVLNNGHTIEVEYEEGSFIELDGVEFDLAQFHFHAPSEHTINGRQFPMEMHLVHKSANGQLAVVGLMIQEGAENVGFADLIANMPAEANEEAHVDAHVNVDELLPGNRATYRYSGSLTTPPCSEGVRWLFLTTPIELSSDQIESFVDVIAESCCSFNNRPVQPLNGRTLLVDSSAD